MGYDEIARRFRIAHDEPVTLKDFDPAGLLTDEMEKLGTDKAKEQSEALLEQSRRERVAAQELLYATGEYAVLIELQGRDAAGKDGAIKHAMSGLNPQGCEVHPFKQPTPDERAHDFLWRYRRVTPARGRICIFNRSYYEDVLVPRVHPEPLVQAGLEPDASFWEHRYESINALERHLVRERTVVLKFFLNVSKGEQRKRLLKRLSDPEKHWKFSAGDLSERPYWDDYTAAYEAALTATSTKKAPWYVLPADHKWVARTAVAAIAVHAIRSLDLKLPSRPPKNAAPSPRRRLASKPNDPTFRRAKGQSFLGRQPLLCVPGAESSTPGAPRPLSTVPSRPIAQARAPAPGAAPSSLDQPPLIASRHGPAGNDPPAHG